ncbi:MAG: response regulator transcription factor [Xanthomonadaceae bacterium]|nr:response regulator transcription factor [Xanthomonadaceae bacterium]MDE2224087.1 response regulator transcription factor [Xanthomonadaceae bacterium]
MNEPLRALIVDDEPPARQALLRLLRDSPEVAVAGIASDGLEALEVLARETIDLLFLDIEMPALAGLELATRLQPAASPVVVFVTAWPQYAVAAFDVDAADYLLKPVDPARLAAAVARARQRLARPELDASLRVLRARQPAQHQPDHVWVEQGATRLRLPLDNIEWFAADGDYVQAHTATRSYLMHGSLNQLESALHAARVLRIHRSTLINVDAVTRVTSVNGQLLLATRSGATLQVGRRARARVKRRLE